MINGSSWKFKYQPLVGIDIGACVSTAEFFTDRTDVQCLHRWQKVLNPDLVKGPWTKEVSYSCVKPWIR